MSGILTPGYLRWDGTKYVLDNDIEIVGPSGGAGPTGPLGPAGPPGPNGTASGDLLGTYPGPVSVIGLTGVLGVVNFGSLITNPTITQIATGSTVGQSMSLKAQGAAIVGGDVIIQSGTGTTAGVVKFLVGNVTAGQFDANGTLRIGPNGGTNASVYGGTTPVAGNDALYSFDATSNQSSWRLVSGSISNRAVIEAINSSGGISSSIALRVMASGASEATTAFAGNGILEQVGASTSALVFSKALGNLTSRGTTGRIFQSGAWGIGDTGNSSTTNQVGLVGPLLNFALATGTLTTTTGQGVIYKTFGGGVDQGTLILQGNTAVNLVSATTTVASTTTTKLITYVGKRIKVTTTTTSPYTVLTSDEIVSIGTIAAPFTVNLPATPTLGDTYTIKDANGSAALFNITISGNGVNIDGGFASIVLITNFTQATFIYNGTTWISSLTNNVSPNAGYTSVVNVPSGGSTTVTGFDQLILCDPTSTTCTVTAPATPIINMRFTVKDATFTANGTHFIAVSGNGKTLEDPNSPGTYTSPVNLQTAGRSAVWAFDSTRNRYTLIATAT